MNLNPNKFLYLTALAICPATLSYSADAGLKAVNNARLEVVANTASPNSVDEEPIRIVKKYPNGEIDKKFTEVTCIAKQGMYAGICEPIPLPDGAFLLKDCFTHDSDAQSCRLVKFDKDGTLDAKFSSPFNSFDDDWAINDPENEILSIDSIQVSPDGVIHISGTFISSLVGWTRKQADTKNERENNGEGQSPGRAGTVLLKPDGKFISFLPKL